MPRNQLTRKRETIFAAWMGECAFCGGKADTLDHLICIANWGSRGPCRLSPHGYQNLVPACGSCNGAKGTRRWRRFCTDPERRDRIERYVALMLAAERRRVDEHDARQAARMIVIGGKTDFSFGARVKGALSNESEQHRTDALAPSQ